MRNERDRRIGESKEKSNKLRATEYCSLSKEFLRHINRIGLISLAEKKRVHRAEGFDRKHAGTCCLAPMTMRLFRQEQGKSCGTQSHSYLCTR